MRVGSVLVRETDGKEFVVTDLGHWSIVRSADGEEYTVKFYGPGYVGVHGPTFVLKKEDDR